MMNIRVLDEEAVPQGMLWSGHKRTNLILFEHDGRSTVCCIIAPDVAQ